MIDNKLDPGEGDPGEGLRMTVRFYTAGPRPTCRRSDRPGRNPENCGANVYTRCFETGQSQQRRPVIKLIHNVLETGTFLAAATPC